MAILCPQWGEESSASELPVGHRWGLHESSSYLGLPEEPNKRCLPGTNDRGMQTLRMNMQRHQQHTAMSKKVQHIGTCVMYVCMCINVLAHRRTRINITYVYITASTHTFILCVYCLTLFAGQFIPMTCARHIRLCQTLMIGMPMEET